MPWYRHLLWPFALVYGVVMWLRNRLFDRGILRVHQFDVPLICVGNLETGGTGKSPIVLYLLNYFHQQGIKVALISRGYGRRTKGFRYVSVSDDALSAGDEPLQAKLRYPDVTVAVCADRVMGIRKLLESENAPQVIVMDDGFQHRRVKPSLSMLVTSAAHPYWKNHLLPVGSLREARSEAARAHVLVVMGEQVHVPHFKGGVVYGRIRSGEPVLCHGSGVQTLHRVILLSAIANAERFEQAASLRFEVLDHLRFADHHHFTAIDLKSLRKKIDSFADSAIAVLTTEKDAARLRNAPVLDELKGTSVYYLPIEVTFMEGKTEFHKIVEEHGKYVGKDQ